MKGRRAKLQKRPVFRPKFLIGFSRSRIVRHQVVDGVFASALVPFRHQPDLTIDRHTEVTAQQQAELEERYLLSLGLPPTYCDESGERFFVLPDDRAPVNKSEPPDMHRSEAELDRAAGR